MTRPSTRPPPRPRPRRRWALLLILTSIQVHAHPTLHAHVHHLTHLRRFLENVQTDYSITQASSVRADSNFFGWRTSSELPSTQPPATLRPSRTIPSSVLYNKCLPAACSNAAEAAARLFRKLRTPFLPPHAHDRSASAALRRRRPAAECRVVRHPGDRFRRHPGGGVGRKDRRSPPSSIPHHLSYRLRPPLPLRTVALGGPTTRTTLVLHRAMKSVFGPTAPARQRRRFVQPSPPAPDRSGTSLPAAPSLFRGLCCCPGRGASGPSSSALCPFGGPGLPVPVA